MTDIPRSVMEDARKLARWIIHGTCGDIRPLDLCAERIARFALSRDKRAAEIAQDLGDYIAADAILAYDTPTGQEDGT